MAGNGENIERARPVDERVKLKDETKKRLYELSGWSLDNKKTKVASKEKKEGSFVDLFKSAYEIFEKYRVLREKTENGLKKVSERIDLYKKKYPNDPDLKVLEAFYADLKADFENARKMKLDESFDEIMKLVEAEVIKAGVVQESPDHSSVPKVVKALRACGIEPEYVVSANKKGAKTVVFFRQIHGQPGIDMGMRASLREKSQLEIYNGLLDAYKHGLFKTVYGEGIAGGLVMSRKDNMLKMLGNSRQYLSYFRLKAELGDKIRLVGMEDVLLEENIIAGLLFPEEGHDLKFRVTADNVLLASNINDDLSKRSEPVTFVVLGSAHENDVFNGKRTGKGHLPFSHALAYFGYNVVVVDASSKYLTNDVVHGLLVKK